MDIIDYLMGAGIVGFICLVILFTIFLICAPLIVAILIANYFSLAGVSWWAAVIVLWLIISGIISKLST